VIVNAEYPRFLLLAREIRDLGAAGALLAWDQEVLLPPKGLAARARHRAALAGVVHEKMDSTTAPPTTPPQPPCARRSATATAP
jgi:Zn-dependent M32 family carboxypeptidase